MKLTTVKISRKILSSLNYVIFSLSLSSVFLHSIQLFFLSSLAIYIFDIAQVQSKLGGKIPKPQFGYFCSSSYFLLRFRHSQRTKKKKHKLLWLRDGVPLFQTRESLPGATCFKEPTLFRPPLIPRTVIISIIELSFFLFFYAIFVFLFIVFWLRSSLELSRRSICRRCRHRRRCCRRSFLSLALFPCRLRHSPMLVIVAGSVSRPSYKTGRTFFFLDKEEKKKPWENFQRINCYVASEFFCNMAFFSLFSTFFHFFLSRIYGMEIVQIAVRIGSLRLLSVYQNPEIYLRNNIILSA